MTRDLKSLAHNPNADQVDVNRLRGTAHQNPHNPTLVAAQNQWPCSVQLLGHYLPSNIPGDLLTHAAEVDGMQGIAGSCVAPLQT